MPRYNLPSKILCKVAFIYLKAEDTSNEVFAQITLLPEEEDTSLEDGTSLSPPKNRILARSFSKKLTPSDTSTQGGFSVPKRHADACFPPLDMSRIPPAQDLVAQDLQGSQWRFRHIYRGQPKRHMITSGWSTFVSAKKLVAGDECIFLRGENGEFYVGFCRARKPQYRASASILSNHSMQHGILATAFHAISSRTVFTVYYRPWMSPAEFIIPYDKYMRSVEVDYSFGTRFKMHLASKDYQDTSFSKFAGTIVGVGDIDCIKWPGSDWKCLRVQWDNKSDMPVRPERVSPWSIEPSGITKKKRKSIASHPKREPPFNTTMAFLVKDGSMKSPVECTSQRHLGILQGQEIRVVGAHKQGALTQTSSPHFTLQPNHGGGQMQVGSENMVPFQNHDPFFQRPDSATSILGGTPPNTGLANSSSPPSTSFGPQDNTKASKSLSMVNVNSNSSVSHDRKAPRTNNVAGATQDQASGSSKCMLFGVEISSQSMTLETTPVSEPFKHISGSLPKNRCKNCCSISNRNFIKVMKYGTVPRRFVSLTGFDEYEDLVSELDKIFDFNGTLIDGSSGWVVTYKDSEGDLMLLGDNSWPEFLVMVRKIFICKKEDADKVDLSLSN